MLRTESIEESNGGSNVPGSAAMLEAQNRSNPPVLESLHAALLVSTGAVSRGHFGQRSSPPAAQPSYQRFDHAVGVCSGVSFDLGSLLARLRAEASGRLHIEDGRYLSIHPTRIDCQASMFDTGGTGPSRLEGWEVLIGAARRGCESNTRSSAVDSFVRGVLLGSRCELMPFRLSFDSTVCK